MMKKSLIAAALLVAAGTALAQAASAPAIAPAKLALINKLIQIQQPGIETIAKGIVQQMLAGVAQGANQALSQQPTDKREALAKSFPGERPDFVSLEGYLAANLLLEGFRRAGPAPTTDSVIGALEQIQNFEMGIGAPLSFGPSEHQASHKVWGTVLDEACNYQVLDME